MGLFRLLLRAMFRSSPSKALYTYERPQPVVDQGSRPNLSTQVSRKTLASPIVQSGDSLIGNCWVIDGDTIVIGGRNIRLAGIDAPELDHPYGKVSKSALVRLCQGQKIRAVFDGASSYERNMATCYLPDGRDLSAEMVKLGMAIDWPKFSGGRYRQHEIEGIRKKLWRCDARQKGRMPPLKPGQD